MSGQIEIYDVEGDKLLLREVYNTYTQQLMYTKSLIAMPELTTSQHEVTVEEQDFIIRIKYGWNMLGFPFDLSTVTKIETFNSEDAFVQYPNSPQHTTIPTLQPVTHYLSTGGHIAIVNDNGNHATYSNSSFYQADTHNTITVTDLFAGVHSAGNMIIAKDYIGNAYLPEFNFDGVGGIHRFEGIQYKTITGTNIILRIRAKRNHRIVNVNGVDTIQYGSYFGIGQGWQLINNPFYHEVYEDSTPPWNTDIRSVEDVFQIFVEDIIIAKNNTGSAYLPEWNFNGIGDFMAYNSYQLKTLDGTSHSFFVADL
jgi:hypothetical protein